MDLFLKRFRFWRRQYLHVVIYTSLFWIFIDVFFIMLFSDCTNVVVRPCSTSNSLKEYEKKNIDSIDQDIFRHPKFRVNQENLKNDSSHLNQQSTINKKKTLQTKKDVGFMARWFGSGSGSNPSNWPGEQGRAVVIPVNLKDQAKKRFPENQFNIVASDLMALNRTINDQRSSKLVSMLLYDQSYSIL